MIEPGADQRERQPSAAAAPVIDIVNAGKVYAGTRGPVVALEGVSLQVQRGQIVAFLGPSGCGKSTLLDIIAGLANETSGTVAVEGEPPRPRREVGLMFQKSLLFPWRTVQQNVMLSAEVLGLESAEANRRARELLDLIGLDGWDGSYPSELSGGMQQRVALARVLLPDPDVLLLDEPFGALDEMTRETMDLELQRIAGVTQKTVVLVTHSAYEAVLISDRIHVFTPRPGRIVGVVDIDLPRPRTRHTPGTPDFAAKLAEVRKLLLDSAN